jgi:hypothetical protein
MAAILPDLYRVSHVDIDTIMKGDENCDEEQRGKGEVNMTMRQQRSPEHFA